MASDSSVGPSGLQAVAPDGARWGYPVHRPAAPPQQQDDVRDERGNLVPRAERTRQLQAEMVQIEADVDDAVDVITRERIKDQVYMQLSGWRDQHLEAVVALEKTKEQACLDGDAVSREAREHHLCAAELERILGLFMNSTDPAEMMELDELASAFDPENFGKGGSDAVVEPIVAIQSPPTAGTAAASLAPEVAATVASNRGAEDDGEPGCSSAAHAEDGAIPPGTELETALPTANYIEPSVAPSIAHASEPAVLGKPAEGGLVDDLRAAKARLGQALLAGDPRALVTILQEVDEMKLKWDPVREVALGKEIGLCGKHENPEVAALANKLIGKIHKLSRTGKAGYSYSR